MLQHCVGLSADDLAEIAELEARVVAHDGGRLKLEYGVLRQRPADRVSDLVVRDGGLLVGFLGLYAFGAPTVELAGMVDPGHRRHGIGSELVREAQRLSAERQLSPVLLVTPRNESGGTEFARSLGAEFDHAEHAMLLTGDPRPGRDAEGVVIRPARADDRSERHRILADAFGYHPDDDEGGDRDGTHNLAIEHDGRVVGTVRLSHDDTTGGVYGFAVDAAYRGRGIGRTVLRRVCHDLRAAGAQQVRLEVAVDNEHALGLYTSVGFMRVNTEDYFRLPPR